MREFFTIAIFKIKADIRMNKTTLNSQKEKHSMLSLRRATYYVKPKFPVLGISIHALLAESDHISQDDLGPYLSLRMDVELCGWNFTPIAKIQGGNTMEINPEIRTKDPQRAPPLRPYQDDALKRMKA